MFGFIVFRLILFTINALFKYYLLFIHWPILIPFLLFLFLSISWMFTIVVIVSSDSGVLETRSEQLLDYSATEDVL